MLYTYKYIFALSRNDLCVSEHRHLRTKRGIPSVMSAVREPRGEVLVGCFELLEVQLRAILVLQHRPRVCRRGSLC